MDKENILLKKIPDRLTNILKGFGIMIVAGIISFLLFFVIIFSSGNFLSDVQHPEHSITAWIVAGIVFIVSFVKAVKIMFR